MGTLPPEHDQDFYGGGWYTQTPISPKIGPLVNQVFLSQVTWLFWCAWWSLFGKCVSIVIYAHFFLSDKRFILLNCVHKFFFLCAFLEFVRILASPCRGVMHSLFLRVHECVCGGGGVVMWHTAAIIALMFLCFIYFFLFYSKHSQTHELYHEISQFSPL